MLAQYKNVCDDNRTKVDDHYLPDLPPFLIHIFSNIFRYFSKIETLTKVQFGN